MLTAGNRGANRIHRRVDRRHAEDRLAAPPLRLLVDYMAPGVRTRRLGVVDGEHMDRAVPLSRSARLRSDLDRLHMARVAAVESRHRCGKIDDRGFGHLVL